METIIGDVIGATLGIVTFTGLGRRIAGLVKCRNLIKKPWNLITVLNMNPNKLGAMGPGFLNQVPTSFSPTSILVRACLRI